ncbi:MAG: lysylphosphatidylglycerol synthase transmembrane domain-containing protein [Bacteroidia bacterium]
MLCAVFLFRRTKKIDFSAIENLFYQSIEFHWWMLLIAIFLIFVNWGLETVKWKFLIKHIEPLSFLKAFSAVMAGVTVSSFTPNRVGEFAGRMMFLKNKLDGRVIALTVVGSMSQLMMTIVFGLPGFLIFLKSADFENDFLKKGLQLWILTLPFLYTLFFWNLPLFFRKAKLLFKNNQLLNYVTEGAKHINMAGLKFVSILSFFRYLIFMGQYILLLSFFEVNIFWWQYLVFIPAVFFIQSLVPSFLVTEIGIRVTAAVAVFGFIPSFDGKIMAASSLLWVINLMVPAIIGVFTLLFTKINNMA